MTQFSITLEDDRPQLVDLNGDNPKFELNFSVKAKDNAEFKALVLSQTDIDKYSDLDQIQMKMAPGHIKGSVISNENEKENYFILIQKKKDNPPLVLDFNVEINIPPNSKDYTSPSEKNEDNPNEDLCQVSYSFSDFLNDYFYILIFFFLTLILIYYYYNKKLKNYDQSQSTLYQKPQQPLNINQHSPPPNEFLNSSKSKPKLSSEVTSTLNMLQTSNQNLNI